MPNPWARVPLGEIAREVRDRLDPANEPNLPYVGLADVEPRQRRIPAYGVLDDVSSSKTRFRPGDVLFGKLRPYLHKVAQADREGGASTDILVVRPRNGLEPDFLYWRLTSDAVIEHAERHSAGTKMPRTSWARLAEFEVPLPTLPEQKKIAAILSSVDDAVAATRKVIEQTKRVKQGLLQTLLTRGIGHSLFRKTEIGEIPASWEVVRLEDLGRPQTQTVRSGPFGSSLKGEHFSQRGTPVLTIQSLGEGRIETQGLFYVPPEKAAELREYKVTAGDLVFSRVADIGRSIVIEEQAEGWIISSNLIRISVDPDRVNPWYMMHCIVGGGPVTKQIERLAGDHGRPVVSSTMLKDLRFPLAPKKEQDDIVARIQSVDDAGQRSQQAVSRLAHMKRGLMHDLLTGRVRVQPD